MKIFERQADALIPTEWGNFKMVAYSDNAEDPSPHLALVHEDFEAFSDTPTVVRIHSECVTGDIFHSYRCDCGEQLAAAMQLAAQEGGIVLYLRQEGRGIGLINKLKAYRLQDTGIDTAQANIKLGFPEDARTYEMAAAMLADLGVKSVNLLTNNPLKMNELTKHGIKVSQRTPLIIASRPENRFYLETKRKMMGHWL